MVTNTMVYLLDNASYIIVWLQTLWYIYWIMLVTLYGYKHYGIFTG